MRVAFPTNNQKTIANHIGLAKGFLIIDTKSGEKFYIENPVLEKIQEEHIDLKNTEEGQRGLGTGRVIPPLLKEAGVDVLIVRDFGEGMIRNLEFEGISAIETDIKNINEALNSFKEGKMEEIARVENFDEEYNNYRYGRRFRYGRGFGYGRGLGFRRGGRMGYGHGRGNGYGYGCGCRRGLRRRWED